MELFDFMGGASLTQSIPTGPPLKSLTFSENIYLQAKTCVISRRGQLKNHPVCTIYRGSLSMCSLGCSEIQDFDPKKA